MIVLASHFVAGSVVLVVGPGMVAVTCVGALEVVGSKKALVGQVRGNLVVPKK